MSRQTYTIMGSDIILDIGHLSSPSCLLGTFLTHTVEKDLNPDLYQLVWQFNHAVVPLHCQTKILDNRVALRLKPLNSIRMRQCRIALKCQDREIEDVFSTRQTFWDILSSSGVAHQIIGDKLHVADIRIDGGTHISDPFQLMYTTLEAIGLGMTSNIKLHVGFVASPLSKEELQDMHLKATEWRAKLRPLEIPKQSRPDMLQESESEDELDPSDFTNFRNAVDLKSGKIDRFLCELRRELPITKFRDVLKTLSFALRNIIKSPDEMKYRMLKTTNPTLKENLFQYEKVTAIICILGFTNRGEFYEIGEPIELPLLQRALLLLQRQQNRAQPPVLSLQKMVETVANREMKEDSQEVSGPVERDLTIFDEALGIPQNPQLVDDGSADYNDGDLELLTAAARDLHRRAKYAEVLVPQSFVKQQLQATSTYVRPTHAKIRVRIQRRMIVQANFSAHETLRDVFDVVHSVLKDPERRFRLVLPPATVLDEAALDQTLLELKMAPSALMFAEFSEDIPLDELMTPEALSSAKKLEFQERPQPASENTSNNPNKDVRQKPIRPSRSGGGKVPAWFKH